MLDINQMLVKKTKVIINRYPHKKINSKSSDKYIAEQFNIYNQTLTVNVRYFKYEEKDMTHNISLTTLGGV